MESYKSGNGTVVSQDNYTQSCQIGNGNCYVCGELGHFAKKWPTKKRSNGVQLKPKDQQKCYWGQRGITGIWTDGSNISNFNASESSSASYSSQFDSSLVSDSSKISFLSMKKFKDMEEMLTRESLQIAVGTSLSQIIEQISKPSRDPTECHKAVQTMHNLSVLLLINSSFSDNLNESDLQTLQSVISNLSLCIMKRTGVSKSTDVAASMLNEQLVAANLGQTQKDYYAAEEKEDAVGARFFQMPTEDYLSQMVNIEVELNSIKSEISCLRSELEMQGVKKAHAGTCENGDVETSANRNDVNYASCPELNLVMKENNIHYTSATFSKERNHCLPDLNLDPIMGDESFIDECYIKKYVDNGIFQNNTSEELIQKSNLNNTAYDPVQENAEAETKQIEDDFTVLQEPRIECPTNIGSPIDVHDLKNVDVGHALEENPCLESDSTWEEVNFSEEDHN